MVSHEQRVSSDPFGSPWNYKRAPDNEAPESMQPNMSESLMEESHRFVSIPPPPPDMWDTDQLKYLDLVKCHASVRLTCVDLKNGRFEGFLKCHWILRTLHRNDRTEPRVRVPGIRMPKLVFKAEESRIWREISKDSDRSMCWHGTSLFSFSGYEIFEVHDFPFDRQVINLELLEFVWRTDKDAATHEESMKVSSLTVTTFSMMPEWEPFRAMVDAQNVTSAAKGPDHCTRFMVKLRLQRKPEYYIAQVFTMSYTILVASLLPLGMAPGDRHVGDRLSLHSGGLLTLVAFRFGIANDLPVVPYETFASIWLNRQIQCLVLVMVEGLLSYALVINIAESWVAFVIDFLEDSLLVILVVGWWARLRYSSARTKKAWEDVLQAQLDCKELDDDARHDEKDFFDKFEETVSKLPRLADTLRRCSGRFAGAGDVAAVPDISIRRASASRSAFNEM